MWKKLLGLFKGQDEPYLENDEEYQKFLEEIFEGKASVDDEEVNERAKELRENIRLLS